MPVGLIAVAAAVAVTVVDWPLVGGTHHRAGGQRPARVVASGRILAQTITGGGLVVAAPGARTAASLAKLGQFPAGLQLAPDGRYVWLGDGQVLSLASLSHLAVTQTKAAFDSNTEQAFLNPFAGHDRYAVLLESFHGAPGATAHISVNSLATGKKVALGMGKVAVADPKSAGAYVPVTSAPRASASGNQVIPDTRLELRIAGHRPVVVVTAATLNHALGTSRRRPIAFTPFPSPTGNKVAVEVETATASPTVALVILSRAGKILDVPPAPGGSANAVWSPGGAALAYITLGATGRGLTVWTAGGGTITTSFPFTGARYRICVWSPDGVDVLCSDPAGRQWAVAHAGGGDMIGIPGRGIPIAWLR
jgi:hypothetical protein